MKKIIAVVLSFLLLLSLLSYSVSAEEVLPADSETTLDVTVNAKACLLMDLNTGTVLQGKNIHEKLYPASVTKIMTLLLVCTAVKEGKLSFEESVTCSETAAAKGGSQIWLEPGEVMTVRDLLKASFVYSANDACTLLAETIAGSEEAFTALMNRKAQELGMTDTHFDNCTGLDDDTTTHQTTAYDVALMARALMEIDFVTDFSTIWMDTLRNGETQLVNTNRLVRFYVGATGLKTGTTSKAGCCVAATAERDGLKLAAVILGADNSNERFAGAKTLLDYGFAGYEIYTPQVDETALTPVKVIKGTDREVPLYAAQPQEVLLGKGKSGEVTAEYEISESTQAPVQKGTVLGKIRYRLSGEEIASVDLLAGKDVELLTFGKAFWRILTSLKACEEAKIL